MPKQNKGDKQMVHIRQVEHIKLNQNEEDKDNNNKTSTDQQNTKQNTFKHIEQIEQEIPKEHIEQIAQDDHIEHIEQKQNRSTSTHTTICTHGSHITN